ncbi:MAG TPA: hypothetical protein VD846_05080 [Allosphingosinicella sp.]|nr:hypothetical protein [Allosphingosinicella sp.]
MHRLGLALAALAAALAPAGAAWAQTAPAAWINGILGEWDAIQKKEGWLPQVETRPGALASGAEARLEYPLAAGAAYRFVVICEPGCGAGDVELLDPSGARVGEPKPLVEMPRLEAAPAAAGTYTLRVAMTDCAAETCAWAARVYARSSARPRKRK